MMRLKAGNRRQRQVDGIHGAVMPNGQWQQKIVLTIRTKTTENMQKGKTTKPREQRLRYQYVPHTAESINSFKAKQWTLSSHRINIKTQLTTSSNYSKWFTCSEKWGNSTHTRTHAYTHIRAGVCRSSSGYSAACSLRMGAERTLWMWWTMPLTALQPISASWVAREPTAARRMTVEQNFKQQVFSFVLLKALTASVLVVTKRFRKLIWNYALKIVLISENEKWKS